MKSFILLALALTAALAPLGLSAQDVTPPLLDIQHTWIEKVGNFTYFKMLLDPRDETGFPGFPATAIQFRSKLNSTAALPANTAWNDYPWVRGEPFSIGFNCTSVVFEIRAKDAAGNVSPLQRRTFKSPFPLSPPPNLEPKFGGNIPFAGAGLDCRGLYAARFDNEGYGDDIMQLDRTTGVVSIRRQGGGGVFVTNTINLTPGSINDSAVADFNGDGRPDFAVVVDNTLKVFINDGVVSNNLQFTETPPAGLATTGISTVLFCAAGDMTGEGKPEIVITGTGDDGMGGTVAKVAWLLNNNQFQLSASNYALPSATTGAGRIGLGDVTGDGWADLVMADTVNEELVLFQNTGVGAFAGDDHATEALRPQRIDTGFAVGGLPAQSLAVGDVTGDGRADAVITMHFYASLDAPDNTREHLIWQLFDGRGSAPLHANGLYRIGADGPLNVDSDYQSDVILQDLTGDRFPELVFTSHFEAGPVGQPAGGIRAVRIVPQLNSQNFMTGFDFTEAGGATSTAGPHRLAAGRFSGNSKRDILVANSSSPQIQWVFNNYTQLSKPLDGAVGVTTDSDASGTADSFGARSYFEYLNGSASFSLTFVNNTANDINGAFADCTFPANFSLNSDVTDVGWFFTTVSGVKNIRWPVDIPAGSAVVRTFRARIISGKAKDSIKLTANLRQGTVVKPLFTVAAPVVQIGAANFTAAPNSPGQPWFFTYNPTTIPENSVAAVQTSPNGTDWTMITSNHMSLTPGTSQFTLTTTDIPAGSHYFRGLTWSYLTGYRYSSVVDNYLPATTGLKISTKSPPKSGQAWTFSATQASNASSVSVRFQSTETPLNEGSWTDLPEYTPVVRKTSLWTSNTLNVPSGSRHFRAISSAPGWVDSISASFGPVSVAYSALSLPPFSHWHIDYVDVPGAAPMTARNGEPATFSATTPTVGGSKVRFQSKLQSEDDSKWTDLPDGTYAQAGTKWTFKTTNMPVGVRDWRAISSAPGYIDNTTQVYQFEVLPPRLPQIGTYFGPFTAPVNGGIVKAGVMPVSLTLLELNGVQKVSLEYATTVVPFKAVGVNLTQTPGTFTFTGNVNFTGAGLIFLRAVVVDGYDPSQTTYSPYISFTIGQGGGTSGPTFSSPSFVFTQSTAKTRGSVKIKARIGDDKQVYQSFLHRCTDTGGYISTVGQMIPAGNTNPAEFSCTDANLNDGTYYYRVVAQDYDGMETIYATYGPFNIVTPQPPPPPANVDVAVSSRFVSPTVPAGKYNHDAMAYPEVTNIVFNFSGLPSGTTTFHAYRILDANGSPTFLNRNQAVWTATNTKTSGSTKFPSPFWTRDTKNPLAGEGTYRIVVSQNGTELPQGTGVREFVVGHAWNLPNTFSDLDYGLYWFKNARNGLRCRANQNDEYFDRSKPTVIYVHGWQADEVSQRRRESWYRQDFKEEKIHDCCQIWKDKGYNVGVFNWNQFGNTPGLPDGVVFSQANIYYVATEPGLPAGHSLIHALSPKKKGGSSKYYDEFTTGNPLFTEAGANKTVVDLFLDELKLCMAGYVPSNVSKEFRLIGHSLGTQVVGRTSKLLLDYPQWQVPLPTRIALLELAQVGVSGLDVSGMQQQWITELRNEGIAIECYQSTDLQSALAVTKAHVGEIHDLAAYARWVPSFIKSWNPADAATRSHNDMVRWYMASMGQPEFPAFTYFTWKRWESVGKALSARSPRSKVIEMMGGNQYYHQSEGMDSPDITDDVFKPVNY